MNIWAHTLVKNEQRYLWYAVSSVIAYADRVLLWDTGSSDGTLQIIKELKKQYSSKIQFKEIGEVTPEEYTKTSEAMLGETDADWFIVVDGDEVWWDESIRMVYETIKKRGRTLDLIVNPFINCVGDIYHYQEEAAGNYEIDGKRGHMAIRAVNCKIPGLHFEKPHGTRGLYTKDGRLIQEGQPSGRTFLERAPYMHFTNLPRSSSRRKDLLVPKRNMKLKHELGISFPSDFYYPEVFFRKRPQIVPSPWERMDSAFYVGALIETPLRKAKRRLLRPKVGY
jgi:glycosyltransferase involved in cell wall biosynthesis